MYDIFFNWILKFRKWLQIPFVLTFFQSVVTVYIKIALNLIFEAVDSNVMLYGFDSSHQKINVKVIMLRFDKEKQFKGQWSKLLAPFDWLKSGTYHFGLEWDSLSLDMISLSM